MKSVFKLVLLSLVLLMVAMVSALTAMRIAIHGREVEVPRLVGMSPLDAERAVLAIGLQMQIERQYYSDGVPEGKIMSQLPPPGTKVRRGWQVRVAQSLGPQRVSIPQVTGDTSRAANLNIKRRGLDVGATAVLRIASVPPDQVLAQSPPANAASVSSPQISLLLTAAPEPPAFVMPNFVGQPLASATRTLQDAGLRVGSVTIAATPSITVIDQPSSASTTPPSPGGLILSQAPSAGQKIVVGSPVNFEVTR
jgi:eukaryotic-like serine/threonine-protein kinase